MEEKRNIVQAIKKFSPFQQHVQLTCTQELYISVRSFEIFPNDHLVAYPPVSNKDGQQCDRSIDYCIMSMCVLYNNRHLQTVLYYKLYITTGLIYRIASFVQFPHHKLHKHGYSVNTRAANETNHT
jgi:hypothetical protein